MLYIDSGRKISKFSIMSTISKKCGAGNAGEIFLIYEKIKCDNKRVNLNFDYTTVVTYRLILNEL
jgi:hypothetical protein